MDGPPIVPTGSPGDACGMQEGRTATTTTEGASPLASGRSGGRRVRTLTSDRRSHLDAGSVMYWSSVGMSAVRAFDFGRILASGSQMGNA